MYASSTASPSDLSAGQLLIFRRRLVPDAEAQYRQVLPAGGAAIAFGVPTLRDHPARAVYEVDGEDFDVVAKHTANLVPMIQQTEVQGAEGTGLRAVFECPIKTMNIAHETDMADHHPPRVWQTDTGPLAVPDLFHRHENPADGVSLGYIAINNLQPGNADFVVEQSVPIGEEKVMHFGAPFTLKAKSRLLCVPPPV